MIETSAEELRAVAGYLEGVLGEAVPFRRASPLVVGDAQTYPREAPTDRAALASAGTGSGLGLVHEALDRAIAMLHALADAMDAGVEVSPALLVPVLAYIEAQRASDP